MINGNGLDTGEVHFTLNDDEHLILRPTMRNWRTISRFRGGLAKVRQAILDEDIDAVVFIIRIGTNMSDKDARDLEERVWRNGINAELMLPLFKYLAILNNGGKPLPEDIDAVFNVVGDDSNDRQIEDHSQGNG